MPRLVTDWIMANFAGKLPKGVRQIMIRDIGEQRAMGQRGGYAALGDPCDERTWTNFEAWLRGQNDDNG